MECYKHELQTCLPSLSLTPSGCSFINAAAFQNLSHLPQSEQYYCYWQECWQRLWKESQQFAIHWNYRLSCQRIIISFKSKEGFSPIWRRLRTWALPTWSHMDYWPSLTPLTDALIRSWPPAVWTQLCLHHIRASDLHDRPCGLLKHKQIRCI